MRVVVEVKDRERAQSLTAWKTLLAEATENRQAIAAVGIVKVPDQMPGQRRLHRGLTPAPAGCWTRWGADPSPGRYADNDTAGTAPTRRNIPARHITPPSA